MSIILAIEPDRRRAAQLTAMARAHLRAELLVAPTAAQAVEELGGRVPDVLLTAPLLPSHEETAMAEHLRQLGPAAAHVQTLTIPLLAGSAGERDRPVLSAFRRERASRTEPEGCDPAVFAEQITDYLREAQERRDAPPPPPLRAVATPVVESGHVIRLAQSGTSERLARLLAAAVEDVPDDFRDFASDRPTTLDVRTAPDETAPDIRLSRSSDVSTDNDIRTYEPDLMATAAVPETLGYDESPVPVTSVKAIAMTVSGTGAPADVPPTDVPVRPSVKAAATVVTPRTSRRTRRAEAVRDEWGFFDPNECGFPALIAKLDEIASRESDN